MLVAGGIHFTFEARASLKVISFQRVPPHHVPGRWVVPAACACVAATRGKAAAASTAMIDAARGNV